MQDEIIQSLALMIEHANNLLLRTTLNELQRKFVHAILEGSTQLRDLVITLSEITIESVRQVFDFEARSQLTSIIGYAEVLIDGDEGQLSNQQYKLVVEIHTAGKQLFDAIVSTI